MRELRITISVITDRPEQEVVDMLLDGKIDHAGKLASLVLESESGKVSYMPTGL